MTPLDLISAARRLVDESTSETAGLWGRAAALLARQALEIAVADTLSKHAPELLAAPFRTQFLVLRALAEDDGLAAQAAYTWVALSQATHHQGYELPPSAESLRSWIQTVEQFVAAGAV